MRATVAPRMAAASATWQMMAGPSEVVTRVSAALFPTKVSRISNLYFIFNIKIIPVLQGKKKKKKRKKEDKKKKKEEKKKKKRRRNEEEKKTRLFPAHQRSRMETLIEELAWELLMEELFHPRLPFRRVSRASYQCLLRLPSRTVLREASTRPQISPSLTGMSLELDEEVVAATKFLALRCRRHRRPLRDELVVAARKLLRRRTSSSRSICLRRHRRPLERNPYRG